MKSNKIVSNIGLDIGTSKVKLVELQALQDTVELVKFDLQPIEPDLGSLLKRLTPSYQAVNISVSGAQTVIRYIDFPKMEEAELKQALKFEAQKYIPFPISEVKLDSYILRTTLADNKMLVLVAAVKKDFVNQRLKIIQEAGFKANIVDLDSLALINAFNFNYPKDENADTKNKAVALLNIGASMSNLSILESGLPVLSRDIHIAGNTLTQKIQDLLSIDPKAAEEAKLNTQKEQLEKVIAAADAVLSDLAKELRVSFDYYESQSTSSVTRIFLSGGGGQMAGLKDALANLLGFEVEYWDPFRKIKIPENIDTEEIKALSGQLAVAVGLALRK